MGGVGQPGEPGREPTRVGAAGVEVTAVRYQGLIHDFVMLNVLANTASARAAINQAIDWLRRGFTGRG